VGQHDQVTPHPARYARHPLPEGEGCFATSPSPCSHRACRGWSWRLERHRMRTWIENEKSHKILSLMSL
jgi:hypothetical protein